MQNKFKSINAGDGMNVAYIRVSTTEQNEDRQVEALQKYNIEKWFKEKVSAKDANRPELKNMMEFVRTGDTVYIHEFSRLARNTRDLLEITEKLRKKDVKLVSNKENFDTSTPTGKFMLTTIGAIAEFERSLILERQREGIAIAKRKGVYKGRKKIMVEDLPEFDRLYMQYMRHDISKAEIAKKCKISRPVVDRLIAERSKER